MDISDFNIRKHIEKIDKIQTKEQLKEEADKANIKEAAQISIAGDSADEVNNLMQIFRNAGVQAPASMSPCGTEVTPDMINQEPKADEPETGDETLDKILSPEDEVASEEKQDEVPGQASTTPDPKYQDANYMTKDIAGGINKAKKTYPKVSDGDNPMAVKERLISEYQMFKNKTEPCGTVVTDDMINQKSTK